jgi:hypothetical protein
MSIRQAISLTGVLSIVFAASFRLNSVRHSAASAPSHKAVVVTELFTSEGCSSCPPADEILGRLVQQQPITDVTVLGLSENVDYWNRLGWVDPFSSPLFSQRQSQYAARIFRSNGVYTPQMIIDGTLEEVGSDSGGVYHKIAQAAKVTKAAMNIAASLPPDANALHVEVRVDVPTEVTLGGPANVVLAITEDNLASDVHRGENRGRLLRHNAVVRSFQAIGAITATSRTWSKTTSITLAREWRPADLKVIGFLQEQQSWRIIGAGWSRVERSADN